MAKVAYRSKDFGPESLAVIAQANRIIGRWQGMGLRLTLRQLYYQFIAANAFPNTERSYKRLGNIISDARLAGLVDWSAIEDRTRGADVPHHYSSRKAFVEVIKNSPDGFTLDPWRNQPKYVELWVEKEALVGVLGGLGREFSVPLMANKGYSSQSAMFESARRFNDPDVRDRPKVLLYLGDHDPSGEDMVRDVEDRLRMFRVSQLTVTKVALTMEQIEERNLPPQPAKTTDSRAARYVEEHGDSSWELDALPPDELQRIAREALEEHVDRDAWDEAEEEVENDRTEMREALEGIELE